MKPDPRKHAAVLLETHPRVALQIAHENALDAGGASVDYWRDVEKAVRELLAEQGVRP